MIFTLPLEPPMLMSFTTPTSAVLESNPDITIKDTEFQFRLYQGFAQTITCIPVYIRWMWLGKQAEDFDHKAEALIFEYHNPVSYLHMPDPLLIGSVDMPGQWEVCE
jgi:hypothetical protein